MDGCRHSRRVDRYWQVIDEMERASLRRPASERVAYRRLAVRSYLRLSEDQCDLRAADRVTDEAWRLWRDGIASNLAEDEYRVELQSAPAGALTRPGELARSPLEYDPSSLSPRLRRSGGISR